VTTPSREGTPIDAVLQRRERGSNHKEGKRGETDLALVKGMNMTKSKKQQQTVDTEEVQENKKRAPQKSKQKSNSQGSDDKTSRRSKRTKSNDEVLACGGKEAETEVINLEAMRGAFRTEGSGKSKAKDANQAPNKSATFAEAASKPASQGLETNVTYNKCVVLFAIRVDKGKDTKAGFNKKVIAGLSFIQTYIDKHMGALCYWQVGF
jgi:hypothetical protein